MGGMIFGKGVQLLDGASRTLRAQLLNGISNQKVRIAPTIRDPEQWSINAGSGYCYLRGQPTLHCQQRVLGVIGVTSVKDSEAFTFWRAHCPAKSAFSSWIKSDVEFHFTSSHNAKLTWTEGYQALIVRCSGMLTIFEVNFYLFPDNWPNVNNANLVIKYFAVRIPFICFH
jgi:hypothetical protein